MSLYDVFESETLMKILQPMEIDYAVRAVEAGELVVVPTNRWYMLCCDAGNADACQRIYSSKRRPQSKSLLLVLPSRDSAQQYFQIGENARTLIDNFWPGDLALRLRWSSAEMGLAHSAVGPEVALVGHTSDLMGALAQRASVLLAATSANVSGEPTTFGDGPAITVDEVLTFARETGTELAAVVDNGICPQFTHMTIVNCSGVNGSANIVREGMVHSRALAAALGRELPRL
jgi:L-threonylcarbamoyladenylate synthase